MLKSIINSVQTFIKDEEGASAVEYGLIVGLIAVAIIGAIMIIGGGLENLFGAAGNALEAVEVNGG